MEADVIRMDAIGRAMRRRTYRIGVAAGMLAASLGCQDTHGTRRVYSYCPAPYSPPPARVEPGPVERPPTTVEPTEITLGRSVEGRGITGQVFGDGDDVVLILATIHGNEPAGTPLVEQLGEYLTGHPELIEGRQVVLIPVANPDGVERGTRYNVRGVDLNRNFPAANFSVRRVNGSRALSEPESLAIYDLIETNRPTRIISIHQPLNCIDYDGPARWLAREMAAHCDLTVRKLGGRSGSLGSYAGIERCIPIVTVELPRSASQLGRSALWERYGNMLLAAVCYPDAIAEPTDTRTMLEAK